MAEDTKAESPASSDNQSTTEVEKSQDSAIASAEVANPQESQNQNSTDIEGSLASKDDKTKTGPAKEEAPVEQTEATSSEATAEVKPETAESEKDNASTDESGENKESIATEATDKPAEETAISNQPQTDESATAQTEVNPVDEIASIDKEIEEPLEEIEEVEYWTVKLNKGVLLIVIIGIVLLVAGALSYLKFVRHLF